MRYAPLCKAQSFSKRKRTEARIQCGLGFAEAKFSGIWFPQNLGSFRISQAGEEGSGEESSACSIRFLLAKFGADKNPKYIISQNCLGYFSASGCPSLKEINPRHPPRVFPLGLRAPRLLCVLLFLAIAPVRWRGEGRTLFGGRKESFPQLRSPPRRCNFMYSVL